MRSDSRPQPYTELELVPVESQSLVNDPHLIGVSDTLGRFRFSGVPHGEYTLSINFGENPTVLSPFSTYFYPGSAKRSDAMVFKIDENTRITGLTFKLPTAPNFIKGRVTGRVLWPDGRPAAGAIVRSRDIEFGHHDFGEIRSDRRGHFVINAFQGRRTQIEVLLFDREIRSGFDPAQLLGAAKSNIFVPGRSLGLIEITLEVSPELERRLDTRLGE